MATRSGNVALRSGKTARTDIVKKRDQEMSENQIRGFIGRKVYQSMNDEDGDLSQVRQENFNYYIGSEYGNEKDGYSKHVTREVLETIEWVLPSILRVFTAGDKIVVFDPATPEDEAAADQETDITNYYILKGNRGRGFLSLHHWVKDTLMYPNGYIKVHVEEKLTTSIGTLKGLTPMAVQMVVDDPDTEIIAQETRTVYVQAVPPPPEPGPDGQQAPPPQGPQAMVTEPVEVFDLKIRSEKITMELRLDPVPPEECLVDNNCTTLDLDESDFVCHRTQKSYSQLVNEGYDQDKLDQVGSSEDYQWNDERTNRLFYEDEDPDASDENDASMRQFWVHECYAWLDVDGDGIAEYRRIDMIGGDIFENEETDYQPLVAMSSILMPHKHNGMSYADIVKDLQILQSVLTRQLLDNTYKINVRRKVFSEDALTEDGSTMEAMLNTQAEFIPVRGAAQNAMVPEPTHSIIGDLLPVIQHVTESKKVRTGVSPELSLDPSILQEATFGAFQGALEQASQRVEMLVRILAETGFRFLMLKVHQLLRTNWDIAKAIKIRGKWVDVDPQGWRDRTDLTVNVGLGFNNKQQMLGLLVQLLGIQKEAIAGGLATPSKLYNTLEKLVNSGGLGDVTQYFVDPESPEYKEPQPPPDPQMILAEAQAKALEAKSQTDAQELQGKGQLEQAKMSSEQQTTQMNMRLKAAELQGKAEDRKLKVRELALEELRQEKEFNLKANELHAKIKNVEADTELKQAQTDNTDADTKATQVESSDAYRKAVDMTESEDDDDAETGSDD